eukprot:TRINITY_DN3747_c0_g1_i1.p1 TRINITY_DN3747_c0_g1~~TRINITY_DN3747_c0_g1_i1.p1  ORF type:complete len:371 (+),score=31.48 TRINITY_DN3747_c0_g1_i1:3038-4150(+)
MHAYTVCKIRTHYWQIVHPYIYLLIKMLRRIGSFARNFATIKGQKTTLMAVIGNNPKVPELINKYHLDKYMAPVYFENETEMMKPGNYDSALIVNSNPKQMEEFLTVQKNIKWIHSTMAGVDWVIGDKLRNSDIILTNAKGAFSYSLAEYVLFGILYFCKKTPYFNATRAKHEWAPIDVNFARDMKVGIIGYGDIGYATARLLKKSVKPTIYACCKEFCEVSEKRQSVCDLLTESKDYEQILRSCDFVIGILPKTKDTINFFDMSKFKLMKKSAVFINIGRGVTMVEKDLVAALQDGTISGAVLDVFPQEPLPATSELYDLKNVLMTYHCADRTTDYWERTMKVFKEELKRYLAGKHPKNLVDKSKGYQL